jgi:hypothetical protein
MIKIKTLLSSAMLGLLALSGCGMKQDLNRPMGGTRPTAFEKDPSRPPHPLGQDDSSTPFNVWH